MQPNSNTATTVSMWGMVVAVWISLVGMFVLAVTHDGAIATTVADSATKLVGAAVVSWSTVMGVHIYVNRPQTGSTPPQLPVQGSAVSQPSYAPQTPPAPVQTPTA